MKALLALLLVLLAGCAHARPVDPREFAHRLETDRSVCSATAVGRDTIETAAHCLAYPLATIDGNPVKIARHWKTGEDRVRVMLSGITFRAWAKAGKVKEGERVRFWGQPMGFPFIYREGHVAAVYPDGFVVDVTVCKGDSGSGLFNDSGELVGVVSVESNDYGCTFLGAR